LTLSNIDLSDDYKIIATALLSLLKTNETNNSLKLSNLELNKKIYKNLFISSNELFDELNKKINFISQILFKNEKTETINSNKYLKKLNIFENYFISSLNINNLNNLKKLKSLGILLTKIFKKNIDIQLIRLHNAGLETEILSKIIALNARETKTSTLLKKI